MARALDLRLDRAAPGSLEALLVTPSPSATLTPLVPSVIAGALSPWQVSVPFRPWLRHIKLVHAEIRQLDAAAKRIELSGPSIDASLFKTPLEYDALVMASEPKRVEIGPFDQTVQQACPDDCEQALVLRDRVFSMLASASLDESSRHRQAKLAVVVVGNDSYGASVALQISRLLQGASRHFDRIASQEATVSFVSTSREIETGFGAAGSSFVQETLRKEGISLHLGFKQLLVGPTGIEGQREDGEASKLEAALVIQTQRTTPVCPGLSQTSGEYRSGFEVNAMGEMVGVEAAFAVGACAIDQGPQKASNTTTSVLLQSRKIAEQLVRATASATKGPVIREALAVDAMHLSMDRGALWIGGRLVGGMLGALAGQRAILASSPTMWWQIAAPLMAMGARRVRGNGPYSTLPSASRLD
jgi:NADH dehydrogenase FAD-containing subunit